MVWRRRLVWGALVVAACGGEHVYVGEDGAAGEAGAAGADDGASAPVSGGSTGVGASSGVMSGSTGGAVLLPPLAGAGGTNTDMGTGGAIAPPPIAGSGGSSITGAGDPGDPEDDAGDPNDGAGGASEPADGAGGTAEPDPVVAAAGSAPQPGTAGGPAMGACTLQSINVRADITPTDQCDATYLCDGRELAVTCDGENDGTGTSLCDCRSGAQRWQLSGVIQGETPASCHRGASACLAQWPAY